MTNQVQDQAIDCFSKILLIVDDMLIGDDYVVYGKLKRIAGSKTGCFPGIKTLAERCGISESSVQRSLKRLSQPRIEFNNTPFVIIKKRFNTENKAQMSNMYILPDLSLYNIQKYFTPSQSDCNPQSGCHHPPVSMTTKEHSIEEDTYKNNNSYTPPPDNSPPPDQEVVVPLFIKEILERDDALTLMRSFSVGQIEIAVEVYHQYIEKSAITGTVLRFLTAAINENWKLNPEPEDHESEKERKIKENISKNKLIADTFVAENAEGLKRLEEKYNVKINVDDLMLMIFTHKGAQAIGFSSHTFVYEATSAMKKMDKELFNSLRSIVKKVAGRTEPDQKLPECINSTSDPFKQR